MKKVMSMLTLAFVLLCACTANAEEAFSADGTIEAGSIQTIFAPYSGVVGDFDVQAGDALVAGDALFAISTQKVYADFEGRIVGLFAQEGDSAASVQERYNALCSLEYTSLYRGDCSTTGADDDNEDRIVYPGEKVFIRSSGNNEREGEAVITGVSGKSYTLEVTYNDHLRLNEQIKVYRDSDFDADSCIGSGRLSRMDPVAVTAEGYVLRVHVTEGQQVARGEVLFELVPDAPDGAAEGALAMPKDGVLLSVLCQSGQSVAKDAPMATFCPAGSLKLVCTVDEEELMEIEQGQVVRVTLDAYPEQPIKGVVSKISYTAGDNGYDVTVELEESSLARIGMSATAEFEN